MFQIIKRDGTIADFDITKISLAILNAVEATVADPCPEWNTEEELENYHKFVRIMAELDWPAFLEYDSKLHDEIISCVEDGNGEGICQLGLIIFITLVFEHNPIYYKNNNAAFARF